MSYYCTMKAYCGVVDGKISGEAYTSLRAVCGIMGVSYSSAKGGKREWLVRNGMYGTMKVIHELEVIKIKGRGNK